jgi:hypothetical protein
VIVESADAANDTAQAILMRIIWFFPDSILWRGAILVQQGYKAPILSAGRISRLQWEIAELESTIKTDC